MRKNIFEIVSENIDMESEAERIITLSDTKKTLETSVRAYTMFDFVDKFCFSTWPYRGHCLDVDDYLTMLDYDSLSENAKYDVESLLTLIELSYNFWRISNEKVQASASRVNCLEDYNHLKIIMDDLLNQYNHIAYIDEENNRVLVIEDKPEVTSVAEIIQEKLAPEVIRYNHHSLRGDLDSKKAILIALGAELEPRRKELQDLNKQLTSDIFFMLNNMNIRHNNRSKREPAKYKDYVAKMKYDRLEKWYDELYQMILLAFLLLDNVSRQKSVAELKSKIGG